jgi:hypothetical protein
MKAIVFALIMAVALGASSIYMTNQIRIKSGRQCNINFFPGAFNSRGQPGFYRRAQYSYVYSGLPSWLSVRDSRVIGFVPQGIRG